MPSAFTVSLAAAALGLLACSPAPDPGRPSPPQARTQAAAPAASAPPQDAGPANADGGDVEPTAPFSASAKVDVLIRGGSVIDGTGKPARRADVVVDRGVIVHVGAVAGGLQATRVVEAAGLVVTPGFIDAHAHGDPSGDNRSFLAMGVTTICVGQDGRSASDDRVSEWAKRAQASRPTINVAPFVGHATVRVRAGVAMAVDPPAAQIDAMARLVGEAMDDGAFGLTTGLEYQPGRSAKVAELVALARPVAQRGGVIMSHLRSEDDDAIDGALDELLAQGRAGARVHVAHIKVVYGRGAERAERLLRRLADARAAGVSITADIYPYTASYTGIDIVFPDWAKPPHDFRAVVAKRRRDLQEYLRKRIAQRNGPEATLFGSDRWAGKTLAQVASELKKPFEDVLIDDVGPGGASAAYFVMDQALQDRLAADPHVMIGSDGSSGSRHPRGHGTFARVLRELVVEKKLLSLEEAVRKMTGLTATTVGLDRLRRGLVRTGWAADLLVFDPARVRDTATYEAPNRLAEGFDWVIVNGEVARERGTFTRARAGRVLLRSVIPRCPPCLRDLHHERNHGGTEDTERGTEVLFSMFQRRGWGWASCSAVMPSLRFLLAALVACVGLLLGCRTNRLFDYADRVRTVSVFVHVRGAPYVDVRSTRPAGLVDAIAAPGVGVTALAAKIDARAELGAALPPVALQEIVGREIGASVSMLGAAHVSSKSRPDGRLDVVVERYGVEASGDHAPVSSRFDVYASLTSLADDVLVWDYSTRVSVPIARAHASSADVPSVGEISNAAALFALDRARIRQLFGAAARDATRDFMTKLDVEWREARARTAGRRAAAWR